MTVRTGSNLGGCIDTSIATTACRPHSARRGCLIQKKSSACSSSRSTVIMSLFITNYAIVDVVDVLWGAGQARCFGALDAWMR